ncbi:MAG TPA: GatB/YqeY domain-containing protein [Vicinamibacterales bacterium]|nr:GatB/YqeY domain-containing protein [Vicinamibacterales bacterium]
MVPTLLEQITKDIADAMRQKNQATLAPLRMLKAAIMNREVEKGRALDDAESTQVVAALVKQRRDSIEQFRAGGRQDLVDREQAEVVFLGRYLPPAADTATIAQAIDAAVAETGASGPKDMGKVMKVVMTKLGGLTVDGRTVSELVKSRLTK